jgi:transcription elongation factor GreA
MSQNFITKEGLERLNAELEKLKDVERPAVISDISTAREHGDLRENSEYASAKEKQILIEGRINELQQIISTVEVFYPNQVLDKKEIRFGAKCKLVSISTQEEKAIQIVSPFEANLAMGLIAIDAPVAKSLLGKRVGDILTMISKGKKQEFQIKEIQY